MGSAGTHRFLSEGYLNYLGKTTPIKGLLIKVAAVWIRSGGCYVPDPRPNYFSSLCSLVLLVHVFSVSVVLCVHEVQTRRLSNTWGRLRSAVAGDSLKIMQLLARCCVAFDKVFYGVCYTTLHYTKHFYLHYTLLQCDKQNSREDE